jgi:large subunit ribosomal protein L10
LQKAESVAALTATFNEVGVVVVTRNLGMSVAQSTALAHEDARRRRPVQGFQEPRWPGWPSPTPTMPGSTSCSSDRWRWRPRRSGRAAKVAVDFAKTNDKSGDRRRDRWASQVLNAEGIKALAAMPSLDQLRATMIGLVQAPATRSRSSSPLRRQAGARLRRLRRDAEAADLNQVSFFEKN